MLIGNKTRLLLALTVTVSLSGCFEEEIPEVPKVVIDPSSMNDCIAIENPNDRDICEMKFNEKMKEKRSESLGEKEFKNVEW